jgi:hypothetical protein
MNSVDNKGIVKAQSQPSSKSDLTISDVIGSLRYMGEETIRNLTDLQKHQNSTTATIMNSYAEQIKSLMLRLDKPDVSEAELILCSNGIADINRQMGSMKINDDTRVKEDKKRWEQIGKTVMKTFGSITVVAILVKGAPAIIKSITRKL